MLEKGSIAKAARTITLASCLYFPTQVYSEDQNNQNQTSGLEQKVTNSENDTERLVISVAPESEVKRAIDFIKPYFKNNLDSKPTGIKVFKNTSKKYPSQPIYEIDLRDAASSKHIPLSLLDEDNETIYIIDNGLESYTRRLAKILEEKSEPKTENEKKYEILLKREYSNFIGKDLLSENNFEKFLKFHYWPNNIRNDEQGFMNEIFLEERLNFSDYKKGYSKDERKDRTFCARILNGRTLENLGRVYEASDSSSEEDRLAIRFIDNFEKQKSQPLENISPDEIKTITLDYIKTNYPKDYESVVKSKIKLDRH